MKSDIDEQRHTVSYINECRQLSDVIADNLDDTSQRYESLTSDIDSRLSELSLLEPCWQHFDQSVGDINDWLKAQHRTVSQLQQAPVISQASIQCQVLLIHSVADNFSAIFKLHRSVSACVGGKSFRIGLGGILEIFHWTGSIPCRSDELIIAAIGMIFKKTFKTAKHSIMDDIKEAINHHEC